MDQHFSECAWGKEGHRNISIKKNLNQEFSLIVEQQ